MIVKFSGLYTLEINGTLIADGVTFTSGKATPAKNDWREIKFTSASGSSSIIKNSIIEYADSGIHCSGSSPFISSTTIRNTYYGIKVDGLSSPNIEDNIIENTYYAIYYDAGTTGGFNGKIQGNNITGNGYGIILYGRNSTTQSSPTITGNTITNNNLYGIYLQGNIRGVIEGNNIINNNTGIMLQGLGSSSYLEKNPFPLINHNNIYGSNTLITASSYPTPSSAVIDGRYNWWGSADPYIIGSKVFDYSDNPNISPVIDWSGFLDGNYPGGNPVPGNFIIGGDLVCEAAWTEGESPYLLIGSPRVREGCSLTITTGTEIKSMGYYKVRVEGRLTVDGARFTSGKVNPAKNDWEGIVLYESLSSESSISNSEVLFARNGIYIEKASPSISKNQIRDCSYGIYLKNASPGIKNNTFSENNYGVYVEGISAPRIEGNIFYQNTNGGVYAMVSSGIFNSEILVNTFRGGYTCIYINTGHPLTSPDVSYPLIKGNTLENCQTGIHLQGNIQGRIEENIITKSSVGIVLSGSTSTDKNPFPVINNNSIYNNSTHISVSAYPDPANTVIDARYNWFGTINGPEIKSKIYDYDDNQYFPRVLWEPYRDAPQGLLYMWIWIHNPVPYGFDPNTQVVDFSSHVAEPSNWVVTIRDFFTGQEVRRWTKESTKEIDFIWDGKDDFGIYLPEGWYAWSIDAVSTVSGAVGITQSSHLLMASIIEPTITINIEYPPNSTVVRVYGNYVFFPTDSEIKGMVEIYLQPENRRFFREEYRTYSGTYSFDYETCGFQEDIQHELEAVATSRGVQGIARVPFYKVNSAPEINISSIDINPDSLRTLIVSGDINFHETTYISKGTKSSSFEVKQIENSEIACKRDYFYKGLKENFNYVCNLCEKVRGRYRVTISATECGITNTFEREVDY